MGVDCVNLVKQGFDAWNAEDPQWVLDHMHPEVEWVAPERDPFPGTYKTYEGVQEFWSRWRNAGGQLKFSPEEMIDAGERVVVIAHRWARNDITGLQTRRRQLRPRPGVLRPRHGAQGSRSEVRAPTRTRRHRHRHRRLRPR